ENKFFSYILCILIFFRFIFDGMTYPIFNLIFTISIILIFIFFVFLRLSELKITFLEIFIFLFLIFSLLSTFLSEIKGTGIRYNTTIATYLCLFFLVRNIIKERKILINTLMCATLIITSYGIYQRFWGFEITRKSLMENPELFLHYSEFLKYLSPTFIDRLKSNRIFSTFVYPNIYASFLISLMPLLFFIFVKEYKSYYGFFSIFLFILCLLNLIFTESMGGILIFFFIFHLIFLQFILEERKFKKFVPYVLIFEFILLIIGYQLKILPHIHSLLDRIGYWKASLKVVLLRPIIGVGPENFRYYFLKFKLPEGLETAHAHNLLIEILVENGVIGLFLFCVFIFNLLLDFWKNQMEILNRGIFYLLISFFLHNLIDFNFYDPSVAILFFIFGSPFEQKVKKVYSYNLLTKVVLYLIIIISIGVCFKLIRFENSERYRRYSEREINLNTKLCLLDIAQNWDKRNF
ncbi:MAG: O-antigen ligase family protein, partial [bacterium]|nr:O-antigen ligase family protein [bacterium]MDW8164080.1 O-antigen ligase family protein [Candidatus Omnitrophota bacterium]